MPRAKSNSLEIAYEEIGPRDGRPLLLVMGLGVSLVFWEDELCAMLAERGHRVVRFDNRDVGRSTKLDALGVPNVMEAMTALTSGASIAGPYLLTDMARDTIGLMDALGIERAHVVGASMGGMIAQTMAIEYAERLRSFTRCSTLTSPTPRAMRFVKRPSSRASGRNNSGVMSTAPSKIPFDERRVRARAAAHFDRGYHPPGIARQLVAVVASGDRTASLGKVSTPSLVIHGVDDPLVPVEAGKATAAAIAGASLLQIDGMGHDMAPEVWPRIVDAVSELTAKH